MANQQQGGCESFLHRNFSGCYCIQSNAMAGYFAGMFYAPLVVFTPLSDAILLVVVIVIVIVFIMLTTK